MRLIEQSTQWIELCSAALDAARRWIVGFAVYRSKHWDKLLPWLLLGQVCRLESCRQGTGVFQVVCRAAWYGLICRCERILRSNLLLTGGLEKYPSYRIASLAGTLARNDII